MATIKSLLCTTASLGATLYLLPPLQTHPFFLHHILVPHYLLFFALLLPIPPLALVPPLTGCYLYLFQARAEFLGISFGVGLATTYHLFLSLALLFFDDPKRTYTLHGKPYPRSIGARIPWVLNLLHSPRLLGFNVAAPVPTGTVPSTSRRLLSLALTYLYLDLLSWYMKSYSPRNFQGPNIQITPLSSLLSGTAIYAGIQAISCAAAVVAIHLLHWGAPASWPESFGSFSQLGESGVRGFWTNGWHGLLRSIFVAPGKWLARQVGFNNLQGWQRGAVKMLLLWLPFAVSAGLHYGAAVTRPCDGGGVARLFLLQPLALLAEREVGKVGKRLKVPRLAGLLVSWVWIVAWLFWSSKGFWEGYGEGGLWGLEPVPFSFWRWWKGEGAWRWVGVGGRWAKAPEGGALGNWAWVM